MSALPYHKRYHGDALTGFMSLSLEERGAYQTVLDLIYDRGGPIPNDDRLLAGYMQCSVRKWRSLRDELMAKRKIRINLRGELTNVRAEKELENLAKTHRKLVENGSKGGRTSAKNRLGEKRTAENGEIIEAGLKPGSSEAQASRAGSEARSQNTEGKPSAAELLKALVDFGRSILMESGKTDQAARSMIGAWRRDYGDPAVLSALAAAQEKSPSDPIPWIRRRLEARMVPGDPRSKSIIDVVLEDKANRERAGV